MMLFPHWPLVDVVALSRLGRLSNAERIALVESNDDLEGALVAVGAMASNLRTDAERIVAECEAEGVAVCSYWMDTYPSRLRGIENPPMVLYVCGTLPTADVPSIAVVGTRSCTVGYGKPVTDLLVQRWAQAGCAIVSGLANGIDMLAHEACLRAHGTTVAVIASGIGRITPAPAKNLAMKIAAEGGAVVCEHPCGVAAIPPYFPARNRIIAGLSDAVVVVESKNKGGALITADFARSQHTPVWAVPGPITSSRSTGTNTLIATGVAKPLTSADDLLQSLFGSTWCATQPQLLREPGVADELDDQLDGDPKGVDAIARIWRCSLSEAMMRLTDLELDGIVEQLPGARYLVKPKFAHDFLQKGRTRTPGS